MRYSLSGEQGGPRNYRVNFIMCVRSMKERQPISWVENHLCWESAQPDLQLSNLVGFRVSTFEKMEANLGKSGE